VGCKSRGASRVLPAIEVAGMIDQVFPDSEDCPDCGGFIFRPGPRAGVNENIECVGCGSRFNIARWDFGMSPGYRGKAPIVWAQRIPSEKDGGGVWREDMFPRVCE
jgi:hypothetical protein